MTHSFPYIDNPMNDAASLKQRVNHILLYHTAQYDQSIKNENRLKARN